MAAADADAEPELMDALQAAAAIAPDEEANSIGPARMRQTERLARVKAGITARAERTVARGRIETQGISNGAISALLLLAVWTAPAAAAVPQVSYWDNWTDAAGISHLTRCTLSSFSLRSVAKPAAPEWQDRQQAPAQTVLINVEPPGWVGGWHENPTVQWITPLSGTWSVQASDGSQVNVGPGELMVGEDQGSRPDAAGHTGHLSRNSGAVPVSLMIVQPADMKPTGQPCRFK